MALSQEEKAERARQRMQEKAKQYTLGTYSRKYVAPVFQRMIRAEAGADLLSYPLAIINGEVSGVSRVLGDVVCITCGKTGPWSGGLSGMHTGHFLASRRNSILFEEDNVATQCSYCNRYQSGAPQRFRLWMEYTRGVETIERLERLKGTVRHFTREELVSLRIGYKARLDAAIARMNNE